MNILGARFLCGDCLQRPASRKHRESTDRCIRFQSRPSRSLIPPQNSLLCSHPRPRSRIPPPEHLWAVGSSSVAHKDGLSVCTTITQPSLRLMKQHPG
ncbi:hypothetical protein LEMLEM_LOCUS19090 [Lemmus lemmus]